jgi:hypothetical protein
MADLAWEAALAVKGTPRGSLSLALPRSEPAERDGNPSASSPPLSDHDPSVAGSTGWRMTVFNRSGAVRFGSLM